MGLLDKLLGRDEAPQPGPAPAARVNPGTSADEQALDRYRYMLKTAPPEAIEQAHAEAFAKLTPEQRNLLLQQLSATAPEAERGAGGLAGNADPQSLARLATRAEVRRPGTMERTFGSMGGMGMGGLMAGNLLSTIAGVVIGSAIAQSFFGDHGGDHGAGDTAGGEHAADESAGHSSDTSDTSADAGSDAGDFDAGGFDEI